LHLTAAVGGRCAGEGRQGNDVGDGIVDQSLAWTTAINDGNRKTVSATLNLPCVSQS
jgi:hypothetical protein